MPGFLGYLALSASLLLWPPYGAFLWWLGYQRHFRADSSRKMTIQCVPGWLAWVCGVYPRVHGLSLPAVLAQLSALLTILASLALLAVLLVLGDALHLQTGTIMLVCLWFMFFPSLALNLLGEAALRIWTRARGS